MIDYNDYFDAMDMLDEERKLRDCEISQAYNNGYNKGIDDFIKGIVNYSQKNLTDHLEFVVTLSDLEEIANKLRGDAE